MGPTSIASIAILGLTCFNTTQCPFPQECIIEGPYRRYCADSKIATMAGRTLFNRPIGSTVGLYHCDQCNAPLLLTDFANTQDIGAYQCHTACNLRKLGRTATAPSYETTNCYTQCELVRVELLGSATLGRSSLILGEDPSDDLFRAREATAAAATSAEKAAADLAELQRLAAVEEGVRAHDTAELLVARTKQARATSELAIAYGTEARAQAHLAEVRKQDVLPGGGGFLPSALGALEEAQQQV